MTGDSHAPSGLGMTELMVRCKDKRLFSILPNTEKAAALRLLPLVYLLVLFSVSVSRSATVMPSKKASIMASSFSHMGLVWQQVDR